MTPLCRPYPSPPPAPNRRPSRPAPKCNANMSSIEENLIKADSNPGSEHPFEENSPFIPRKYSDLPSNKSSPLLPIKSSSNKHGSNLTFGKRFLPKTPNSTPFSTPFTKRKNQQMFHQYNQVHNVGPEGSSVEPTRRRLVLHNKSPMWNEASQVYQLDFGGRVTQESAKNFQIEYKGKQVNVFSKSFFRWKYKNRKRFVKQFAFNSNSIPGDAIWKNWQQRVHTGLPIPIYCCSSFCRGASKCNSKAEMITRCKNTFAFDI